MSAGGVTKRSEFAQVDTEGGWSGVQVPVELRWDPQDPSTITLRFPKGLEWRLTRELVIAGLTSDTAGKRDVQFSSKTDCRECVLLTLLRTPLGRVDFHALRADLIDLVMTTDTSDLAAEFDEWLGRGTAS